jgi:pyruvate/2-oxoglutarate dehydrogenase complex dihydrolipoamide dehydrogenase (E3) component
VEKALLSIGRVPNLKELDLHKAGVNVSEDCVIENTNGQTSTPNIHAIGDATIDIALVNIAEIG